MVEGRSPTKHLDQMGAAGGTAARIYLSDRFYHFANRPVEGVMFIVGTSVR